MRRAAATICARRACVWRSFRSAIRVVAIDRKYSAARHAAAEDGRHRFSPLHIYLALLYFLPMITVMRALALFVAALVAVAIIVIGCFYLLSPERISGTFGLKPAAPDADTRAWLRLKGNR